MSDDLDAHVNVRRGDWNALIGRANMAEARASALAQRVDILEKALAESISLQSHYAFLLNDYDGGQRMSFASTQEWIDRLITTGTLIVRAAQEERR